MAGRGRGGKRKAEDSYATSAYSPKRSKFFSLWLKDFVRPYGQALEPNMLTATEFRKKLK